MAESYINSIDQILKIQHYGRFDLFEKALPNDGKLKKVNLIYGPNGSGKTALSLIAQSLATRNDSLILKKASKLIPKPQAPKIDLLTNNDTHISFQNEHWSSYLTSRIKIFNSYFITDNAYTFNIEENGFSILELLSDDDASKLRNINRKINYSHKRKTQLQHYLKDLKAHNASKFKIKQIEACIPRLSTTINKLRTEYVHIVDPCFSRLIKQINIILDEFQTDFRVNLNRKVLVNKENNFQVTPKLIFDIYSDDHEHRLLIRNSPNKISLDYVLSDGDKSALAFALYMALMELIKDPENQIIFVDDPFTSMDSDRRHSTIMYLTRLVEKTSQLFVTSHDRNFLNDLQGEIDQLDVGKYHSDYTELEIRKCEHGKSKINETSFKPTNYNIITYHKFKKFINEKGGYSDWDLKQLGENIRPFLEDAFKFKFPDSYAEGQTWLRNYLNNIRFSDKPEYADFRRLKVYLPQFESILSYTRKFNHSNQAVATVQINESELRNEIKHTLELFNAI
ncbi:AAA family ATPase [Lactobacillus gallinarum]|uniref:AAA family ATPase n=1 Tax=Lactobacillus gallinarum TaxID=52242 RepID=UPI0024325FFC|nr:AAA family ATPase [Lactobacillus gallinarum]